MYPKACGSGHHYPTVSGNDSDSLAEELLAGNPFYSVALPVGVHSVQLVLHYEGCSMAKRCQHRLYVFDLPNCVRETVEIRAGRSDWETSSHLDTSLLDGMCELGISRG